MTSKQAKQATRRIGFVDYQLDNFHASEFLKLSRKNLNARGWDVAKCWAMDEAGGRKWADEKNIAYVNDVHELGDCDGIMILAPSNPEVHLSLAQLVFPLGRTTYVDKTFAPDHETAKKIFSLADEYHVPVMTTSALRCAASLNNAIEESGKQNIRHMCVWGGGTTFEEYAIHPIEMLIAAMGPRVESIMRLADGEDHHAIHVQFAEGRTGSVFVHTHNNCAFQAMITTSENTQYIDCSGDPVFVDLFDLVLDFFESGQVRVDREESLAIRRVLDMASDPTCLGKFEKVPSPGTGTGTGAASRPGY